MLRLSAAPLSSRLGGWALVESPTQHTESAGQQWSFVIVVAATLVAIAAVIFDVQLSSQVSLPVVVPAPTETSGTQRAVTQVAPPPTTTAPAEASRTTAPTAAAESTSTTSGVEPTVRPSPSSATATEPIASGSTSTTTGTPADAVAGVDGGSSVDTPAATVEAAALDDPAARIRQYLGLHAGAQLPVSFSYAIEPGDTASSIAKRFGLEEATVLFNNFDVYDPNLLNVGHTLTLPAVDGLVYTVQPGDSLDFLVENFQASLEATLAYPANGISSPDQILAGQQLLLVHGSASVASGSAVTTGVGSSQGAAVWSVPDFLWPLGYDKISDFFGTPRANAVGYHTGVDFVAPIGTIVGSTAAGQVTVATWDPSYGNWIEIDHGGGYRSRYAHLDAIWVREGEWVQANAFIGTVGNTGNSSGAHLHFEIIIDGQAVNPLTWLN
ncbi:MAG: peptidoglycan DD-metalloendopeptidase family protein [Chloroflexi bacterium]|nr:peptidoglycan DD-metalloendopeptidase family protein [Chloroflexota bacterium]